jgi:preprotein translocase subunit SecG
MQTVLIVIHLMIVLALVGVVLIQRSEGGGLGVGGGSGFMSARGTANALTRTTAILAALFFLTSLGLGVLSRYEGRPTDILNRIPSTTGQGRGVLDSLGGAQPASGQAPANGQAPAAPGAATPATQPTTGQAAPAPAASQPAPAKADTGVPTGN